MPENQLTVWAFRVAFTVIDPVRFPEGKAANTLRGALGTVLRDNYSCSYLLTRLFESRTTAAGLRLANPPKPFLLRAAHLDGKSFDPGQSMYFDLILFEDPRQLLPDFIDVFRRWQRTGIGPAHGKVALSTVTNQSTGEPDDYSGHPVSLQPSESQLDRLTLEFLTPTELKSRGDVAPTLEFHILIRRLRERISNLRILYQGGSELESNHLGEPEAIVILRTSLRQVDIERRSSRTGQRHSIGGFVGQVEYSGDLWRFIPLLKAGEWTGVGRQTVWGKGQYVVLGTKADSAA
ncbi:MAG: CRISPR system precrRNA processing endoribonuclease RAMP protein Cas6 [Acidobacteriota bacterium]